MHELTVAQSLIAAITEEADKYGAKPLSAKLSCGTLSAVNDETLNFAFEVVAKDTLCEGMKLHVEHKPLQAKCGACDRQFNVDMSEPRCSDCGSEQFQLLPDPPLLLEQIEFETDD